MCAAVVYLYMGVASQSHRAIRDFRERGLAGAERWFRGRKTGQSQFTRAPFPEGGCIEGG